MRTEKEIISYLREKEADFDEVYVPAEINGISVKWFEHMFYCINVTDGDWKHSHGYLDCLMEELGYKCISEKQIGHSDDDCYSSVHTYADVNIVKLFS